MLHINLRLFDGEAGTAGTTGAQAGEQVKSGSSQQTTKGAEKVVYGKQDAVVTENDPNKQPDKKSQDANGKEKETVTPEQRKANFEKFMEEHKDLFHERIQPIIDKRFKDTKGLETQLESLKPALDILMGKYGVKDVSKLSDAVLNDAEFIEDLAEKAGMSVEQYKKHTALVAENEALRKTVQDEEARSKSEQQVAEWWKQADALTGTPDKPGEYPSFDLAVESKNQAFMDLLKAGVTLKAAYEVVHMDDIKNGIAKTTAKTVESNVVANIQARGTRPQENALSTNAGVIVKNDVSQLSRQDRAEIAKRAQRGEQIKF